MSESNSPADRYFALIDQIVDITLQGKIRSKQQVYRMLAENVSSGTGEIFERCLNERMEKTKAQLETKLKASRILKALETIEAQWQEWQKQNLATAAIASATEQIISADRDRRLVTFIKVIDPNQSQLLNRNQLENLAVALRSHDIQQLADGITEGNKSFSALEENLISWIYESSSSLGFGAEKPNPWNIWAKKVSSPLPKQLFQTLAQNDSLTELARVFSNVELRAWVELVIILQYLQRGLVGWFDQQPYDAKFGKKLSYSTFLTFAYIWFELSQGFDVSKRELSETCFGVMLQTLRTFTQRDDFPLYSGIFVSFSGDYLQNTVKYFDIPLKQVENTGEKARILTLLGYSQRTLGEYERAKSFHLEALEIAREAEDKPCEIANLNHVSRICVNQKDYDGGINYAQRALILSRQVGDRLGEANALVNLGYSEVFSARQLENMDTEVYERAIRYLEEGLKISERLGDLQSQALGYNSLGAAYLLLSQPAAAIAALEKGTKIAQFSGDVYLQGRNFVYLAEAYYSLESRSQAIFHACLGMYLLEQIKSEEWRQPAGLIAILEGQLGTEAFRNILEQNRSKIITLIGVDGYDHLSTLLEKYKNGN